jgi:DNA-binding protein
MVLFITFVHPVEQVVVAVVLLLGHETDTVLIAAVAFELCATAAVAKRHMIAVGMKSLFNFIIASV